MAMQTSNAEIRPAGDADIPAITAIIRASFHDVAKRYNLTPENCPRHPSNCTEQWVADAIRKGIRYYLMASEERPLGCVAVEQANADTCYLERLSVLPEFRRQGHGRVLVGHALAVARSLGATEIGISMIADQIELKEWYRSFGFSETRRAFFENLPFEVLFMSMKI